MGNELQPKMVKDRLNLGVFLRVAIAVFLLALISVTIVTFILPESYASTARIKVERYSDPISTNSVQPASAPVDPVFVNTECEVIRSEVILDGVIRDLDLNHVWQKKFNMDAPLKTSESRALLKAKLEVRPEKDTAIIDIRVYSDDPREAANIANAIAKAKAHYDDEKSNVLHPRDPRMMVESLSSPILDLAEPAQKPSRPNKPLNIALGAAFGLVFASLIGGVVAFLSARSGIRLAQSAPN